MVEFMRGFPPVLQALVATIFTWLMTALGAGMVFFTKEVNRKLLDAMLGFSGGVMIAASYWSLLAPAIEISESMNVPSWLPPAVGFLLGGVFLWGIDRILPHLHLGFPMEEAEGIKTNLKRTTLLVLAITIHNIPEGLAIGVAFGALASNMEFTTLVGAISLAVGIGIQNFPEGLAVCCFHAIEKGRTFCIQKFLVWATLRCCRAHCKCSGSIDCYSIPCDFALRSRFCSWSDDIRHS